MTALVTPITDTATAVRTDPVLMRREDAVCILELLLVLEELATRAPVATEAALGAIGLCAYHSQELCVDARHQVEVLMRAFGIEVKEQDR